MDSTIDIAITTTPIDVQTAIARVRNPRHGAIDSFIGTVRNHHHEKPVIGITYDIHPIFTEQSFAKICQQALTSWPNSNYYVAHYHGFLRVAEISIIIAVSAAHRAASFEACRYVIEAIKSYSPIWKQEHYADGSSDWLAGRSLNKLAHSA